MACEGTQVENLRTEIPRKKVEYRFGNKDYTNAATYGTVRYIGRANEYRQKVMADAYRRLIGPLHGKRILDEGCGTGRGVINFGREVIGNPKRSPRCISSLTRGSS